MIDAGHRQRAQQMRRKISTFWEGLYTLVIYDSSLEADEEKEEEWLCDPA